MAPLLSPLCETVRRLQSRYGVEDREGDIFGFSLGLELGLWFGFSCLRLIFPQKYYARPIFGFVYCDVYVVGDSLNESRGGLRRNSKKSLRRNSKKSAILRWAFF